MPAPKNAGVTDRFGWMSRIIATQIGEHQHTFNPPSIIIQRDDTREPKPEEGPTDVPIVQLSVDCVL